MRRYNIRYIYNSRSYQEKYNELEIFYTGSRKHNKTYDFRGTVSMNLIYYGEDDLASALLTGHILLSLK